MEGLRQAQRVLRRVAQDGAAGRITTRVAFDSLPAADVPLRGVVGAAQAGLTAIHAVMAFLSGLAIAAAGLVLTWEVIGRYFLGIPSDWQDELATFLLVGATFASAGWTQARRGHVAIDALAHVLPPAANRARALLADALSLAFCAFFAWKSFALTAQAWSEGQITDSAWGPPLWIPYSCMAVGMALLSLQLLLQTLAPRPI